MLLALALTSLISTGRDLRPPNERCKSLDVHVRDGPPRPRTEIDAYLQEVKAEQGLTEDIRRANLVSAAPELLETLKHLLAAIEQGIEINPGLMLEYRFVVERAEGKM